jgi:methylated-DNA-[protein]-cysteine S-methyltransferase
MTAATTAEVQARATGAADRLVVESPVGALVLHAAGGGLVAIEWESEGATAPATNPQPSMVLSETARQLAEYFAGRRRDFDLPLAPAGTPFQRRLWAELCRIPYGATLSYGALARRLGSAAQAVGQACGANPLPIIVPCHRVLAAGGALGGYSGAGGLETKCALLRLEGALL